MIGYKPVSLIKWCWMVLTPGICAVSTECPITCFRKKKGVLYMGFFNNLAAANRKKPTEM